jgi:ketosteroid isomerase-like protein
MSQENVDLVRAWNESWLGGDLRAGLELMAENVIATTPPNQPDVQVYVGRDGLLQALTDWGGQWDEWAISLVSVIDAEPDVVSVHHQRGRGRTSGVEVATELGSVYSVEDGKIVRWQMFFSEQEALEAAGLSE